MPENALPAPWKMYVVVVVRGSPASPIIIDMHVTVGGVHVQLENGLFELLYVSMLFAGAGGQLTSLPALATYESV